MKRYLPKLLSFLPIVCFAVLIGLLFYLNYTPGTYLTGWDNLHPEFNYTLNIKRQFFSVWQEYQGLGLLAGMGHASDLFRELFLYLMSAVIPMSLIRYFYHFLMLFVGITGVFYLLKNIILQEKNPSVRMKGAILGALFYIFNLGTIQYFYVPFEPYSTTWGLFPWGIYTLLSYLKYQDKKHLWLLILVNFLAIAQGYVQTIFLVYVICITIILGLNWLRTKAKKELFTGLKILLVIFIVNSFWLLPNLYFVVSDLSVTRDAMQNRMATEKFFQMNKNRGTIADFPILREFYYDFYDYDLKAGEFNYLMKPWRNHTENPFILLLGYSFFGVIIFGLAQKSPYRKYIAGIFLVCFIIFLSNTFLISLINMLFRSIPIVNQIFRNPFTKFIVPTVFVFALCFGIGFARLLELLSEKTDSRKSFIGFFIVIVLLVVSIFPVFQGKLIAPQMRIKIPNDYFRLFSFMSKEDKNGRVMNLPQGDIWGWYYYEWGLRGSGFLWYGIEQPIMDRAFDVWSAPLENYYWELSYALNKRDKELFNNIIDKYQIRYIIFDDSLLFSDNMYSVKPNVNQEKMLEGNDKVRQIAHFGTVRLYQTTLFLQPANNIIGVSSLPTGANTEKFSNFDPLYKKLQYYTEEKNSKTVATQFPFGSLFTNRFQDENGFSISDEANTATIKTSIPAGDYTLAIPSLTKTEKIIPVTIDGKIDGTILSLKFSPITPQITLKNTTINREEKNVEVRIQLDQKNLNSGLVLNINNKDYFNLDVFSDTYKTYGKTYLINENTANYFRLYTKGDKTTQGFHEKDFQAPHICGVINGKPAVDWKSDETAFTLMAKNTAICSPYPTTFKAPQNSLLAISYEYKSSVDEFPQYCVYSQNKQQCLNKKDSLMTGFSPTFSQVSDYFEHNDSSDDQLSVQFILDALSDEDKNHEKKITYKNVSLTTYPYLVGSTIDLKTLTEDSQDISVKLAKSSTLQVTLPIINSVYSYMYPIQNNLYKKSPLNYDVLTKGSYTLEERNDNKKYLRTSASNASSYLLLRASDLSAGNGYIARIDARNNKSFPYIVNIFTNSEFRSYVYTYAAEKKDFTKNYYILPPYYEFDNGIDILLGSSSYNNSETSNDIADLVIYPIPYNFLTAISLEKRTTKITPQQTRVTTEKKDVTRYSVSSIEPSTHTIIFSQAYHPGWSVYEVKSSKFKVENSIKTFLPFIFGSKIQDHITVNNWENGWTISNSQLSTLNSQLIILFLPQYLQYLGFFFFGGFLVWVLFKYHPNKSKSNDIQIEEENYFETHEVPEDKKVL